MNSSPFYETEKTVYENQTLQSGKRDKTFIVDSLPERNLWFTAWERKDFIVLAKGAGLPSAPLKNGGLSVYEMALEMHPDIAGVSGKKQGEGGLVHRLDSETTGLLLTARTDIFFETVQNNRQNGTFLKEYTAYTVLPEGKLPELQVITSRFRPFGEKGASVKPVFQDSGRADLKKAGTALYTTEISGSKVICKEKEQSLVRIKCRIKEGFRHQVRSHLAWAGYPVLGDRLYGPVGTETDTMQFYASGLSFKTDSENLSICFSEEIMDEKAVQAFRTFFTSLTR